MPEQVDPITATPAQAAPVIPTTTTPVPNGVDPEVHKLMEQRLNLDTPKTAEPAAPAPVTETIVDPPPAVPVDIFTPFKEKFGYEKPEDALTEIEQLRAFKANPTVAEIKFETPESEKVFKALQGGKLKEVY